MNRPSYRFIEITREKIPLPTLAKEIRTNIAVVRFNNALCAMNSAGHAL
jgi:hypothetical protein